MVNDEDLKTHIVEGERSQQHPRTHSSSPVFFDEGSLRRESLRLVSRDPNLVHATSNINVLIFVLHVSLNVRLRLAYTAYFS